jgi:3-oxoacyl-[acyl-carrier-protein] synthase II
VKPVAVVAAGVVSPFGVGEASLAPGAPGELPRTAIRRDAVFAAALPGFLSGRVPDLPAEAAERAEVLLRRAAEDLERELERTLPGWRSLRIALAVGTSGGGMPSLERALASRANAEPVEASLARASLYAGPLAPLRDVFGENAPYVSILAACSSSTYAIGLGCRWLDAGRADLVIAGGYDALTLFVASGFAALGITSSVGPRPFRHERDGMALGEGAALLALARVNDAPATLGTILGFGATSDAFHVTAPEPSGRGLARAAELALHDAGLTARDVELVSAHATATVHNDAAESAALGLVFADSGREPVLHPYKAAIGHTLGAAGALEALAALAALRRGILPASPGQGSSDPALRGRLLAQNETGTAARCLKFSAAFGGANAALVLGQATPEGRGAPRPRRPVRVLARGTPVLEPDALLIAARTSLPEIYRTRLDRASALALTAAAGLVNPARPFEPETTGVVVGTSAASLEANELFDAKRRARGNTAIEPRRFPATSPNLPAGQCSLALGLRGPTLAVGGGAGAALEALMVAHDLVELGDADRVLVIACDDVGAVTRELFTQAELVLPPDGAVAVLIGTGEVGDGPLLELSSFEASGTLDRGEKPGHGTGFQALLAALPAEAGNG